LIYKFVRHIFISTSCSAAVPELWTLAGTVSVMRKAGLTLLVLGFLWIAWDAAFGFTEAQYSMWMGHSQQLPAGDTVTRSQASSAMRELSLALKDMHRVVVIPALLMLAGGFMAAFGQRNSANKALHATATAP
jgi:hypothetical protein